jgi:hypothetical protein
MDERFDELDRAELYEGNNFAEWGFTEDAYFPHIWDFEGPVHITLDPRSGNGQWTMYLTLPNGSRISADIMRDGLHGSRPGTERT